MSFWQQSCPKIDLNVTTCYSIFGEEFSVKRSRYGGKNVALDLRVACRAVPLWVRQHGHQKGGRTVDTGMDAAIGSDLLLPDSRSSGLLQYSQTRLSQSFGRLLRAEVLTLLEISGLLVGRFARRTGVAAA